MTKREQIKQKESKCAEDELKSIFADLWDNAYDPEYHHYEFKQVNQIIRKHFEQYAQQPQKVEQDEEISYPLRFIKWVLYQRIYIYNGRTDEWQTNTVANFKWNDIFEFWKSKVNPSEQEEIIKALSGEKIEDIKTFTSTDYPIKNENRK